MEDFEREIQPLQNKWLILLFFLGAVVLSNNLQWLYAAGPRAAYIITISLGISVIIACTMITAALQHKLFSAPLFLSSGWIGFAIGWVLCVWEVEPYQRKTWIIENLGTSTGSLLIYSAVAGLLLLVTYGGCKLLRRTSVSTLAAWVCFTLAFVASDGLRWLDLLQRKG